MQLVSLSVFLTHFGTAAPKHEQTWLRVGGGKKKKKEEKEGEKRPIETSQAVLSTLN